MEKQRWITVTEAGTMLKVSRVWVHKLIKEGAFTIQKKGKTFYLNYEEVERYALAREKLRKTTVDLKEEVTMLKARVDKLEELMKRFAIILDANITINFTDEQLIKVYERAKQLADSTLIPNLEEWAEILSSIHEPELRRLSILTQTKYPYVPFVKLANRLMRNTQYGKGFMAKPTPWSQTFALIKNNLEKKALIFLSEGEPVRNPLRILEQTTS